MRLGIGPQLTAIVRSLETSQDHCAYLKSSDQDWRNRRKHDWFTEWDIRQTLCTCHAWILSDLLISNPTHPLPISLRFTVLFSDGSINASPLSQWSIPVDHSVKRLESGPLNISLHSRQRYPSRLVAQTTAWPDRYYDGIAFAFTATRTCSLFSFTTK